MKKFFFFACALAAAATMNAQEVSTLPQHEEAIMAAPMHAVATIDENAQVFDAANIPARFDAANALDTTVTMSQLYIAENLMYASPKAPGYYAAPYMYLPYADSTTWMSYYRPADWSIANNPTVVKKANSPEYTTYYGFGLYYVPILGATSYKYTSNDTTINYNFLSYYYSRSGLQPNQSILFHGAKEDTNNQLGMTIAAGLQGNNVANGDFYSVSGIGDYAYGSGIVTSKGQRIDSIGQIVKINAQMKIDQINIPVYSANSVDSLGSMFPSDTAFKITIYPVKKTATGYSIYTLNPIASTYATTEGATPSNWGKNYAVLHATFEEIDEMGITSTVPVHTTGMFYLEITEFNERGNNFGIFSDYFYPIKNSTLFRVGGGYTTLYSKGSSNMHISYNGYFPAVYEGNDTKEMVAPVEGGIAAGDSSNVLYFFTNVDFESYIENEEDVEEWMTVAYDTTYYSSDDAVMATITCDPLPAGVSYREGNAVFNFDGNLYTVKVTQGTPATGLKGNKAEAEDLKKVVRNGQVFIQKGQKLFNVLGNEVK